VFIAAQQDTPIAGETWTQRMRVRQDWVSAVCIRVLSTAWRSALTDFYLMSCTGVAAALSPAIQALAAASVGMTMASHVEGSESKENACIKITNAFPLYFHFARRLQYNELRQH
jgi:hypothetical protein